MDSRSYLRILWPGVLAFPVIATLFVSLNPVGGGLAGGLVLATGIWLGFMRLQLGQSERRSGCRFLSWDGERMFRAEAGVPVTTARRPRRPPVQWRLWRRRFAAAAWALLAAAGTTIVVMALVVVGRQLLFPDRSGSVQPELVAQVVEIAALLLLLASSCLYFRVFLRRCTGERANLLWLIPLVMLQAIPITVYGQLEGLEAVGEGQAREAAGDLAQILEGRPRTVRYEIMLLIDPASAEAPGCSGSLTTIRRPSPALRVALSRGTWTWGWPS